MVEFEFWSSSCFPVGHKHPSHTHVGESIIIIIIIIWSCGAARFLSPVEMLDQLSCRCKRPPSLFSFTFSSFWKHFDHVYSPLRHFSSFTQNARTPCTAVTWCWYWWRSRGDWAAQSTAADETETCRTFSRWFMAHCCCQGGDCVEGDGEDSP